ncbi:MAG: hypothetical protein MI757_07850 [Pirellulales bacterium]|nr:hypothetical protein [Pirellulales bacterium]
MPEQFTQSRTLRVLVVDPAVDGFERMTQEVAGVDLEFCSTAREALRRADEPLDYLLLSTNLVDVAFQDVAEMFMSTTQGCGLIVVSSQVDAAEEAVARQLGAIMYRERTSDLSWLSELRPRRAAVGGQRAEWTLDWHRRRPRHRVREPNAAVSQ